MQMEPKSEREALGDRAERASASGLSSREKYGALSLTLNVSAKRGAAKCSGSQRARFVRRGVWHWQLASRASPARSPASRRTPPSRSPLPTPDSQAPKMLIPSKRHPSPLLSLSLSLSVSLSLPRSLPFLSPSRPHPESGLLQSGEKCSRPSRNTLQQKHERLRLNDRLSLSLSLCP